MPDKNSIRHVPEQRVNKAAVSGVAAGKSQQPCKEHCRQHKAAYCPNIAACFGNYCSMHVNKRMRRVVVISLALFADDLGPVNIIVQQLPQTNVMGGQREHCPQYQGLKGNREQQEIVLESSPIDHRG